VRGAAAAKMVGEDVAVRSVALLEGPMPSLVARVERFGIMYEVSLADLVVDAASPFAEVVAGYRALVGAVSAAEPSAAASTTTGAVIEVAILSVDARAVLAGLFDPREVVTLLTPRAAELVPAEIVRFRVRKRSRRAGRTILEGDVVEARLEVGRLNLEPLKLEPQGTWDPREEYWGEEGEPTPEWAKPIIARGSRPAFELENVIPFADPEDWESDPIVEAAELHEAGEDAGARKILMRELAADLRCLDAHAHLGNLAFEGAPRQALRHYAAGLRIGELSLSQGFDGVLPWGLTENRPFLRCLHGYGLCFYRLGRRAEATAVFERMLWLNPSDNQGARFVLTELAAGRTWEEMQEREDEAQRRLGDVVALPVRGAPVPVDLGVFVTAFEDQDGERTWYLDRETGNVHFVSDLTDDDVLPVAREELEENPRFLAIEPEDTHDAYEDMVEFAETVGPKLRERLADALDGKGAFGRFKRVLQSAPQERERWCRFRDVRLEARARKWLETNGIVISPRGGTPRV
jgi:tetratricopeptide (TPR) repeat protein